jgi:hypothetical protein
MGMGHYRTILFSPHLGDSCRRLANQAEAMNFLESLGCLFLSLIVAFEGEILLSSEKIPYIDVDENELFYCEDWMPY